MMNENHNSDLIKGIYCESHHPPSPLDDGDFANEFNIEELVVSLEGVKIGRVMSESDFEKTAVGLSRFTTPISSYTTLLRKRPTEGSLNTNASDLSIDMNEQPKTKRTKLSNNHK